ncbi:MAG: transcriptional regulator [Oscillospiraceae bacterium]|nr:transcriptional regulator [Oscillospiraceae bacterium]
MDNLTTWDELEKEFAASLTKEEWDAIDLKVRLAGEIIDACDKNPSNKASMRAMEQFENGGTDEQLTTLLKVLRPLGKTLAIVDAAPESMAGA